MKSFKDHEMIQNSPLNARVVLDQRGDGIEQTED